MDASAPLLRAVIVDDEPYMREGLRLLVDWAACGFDLVGEAADANEALALIHRERPDLAVLDIRMPGMEGTQLAERLAISQPNLLVIFMTGYQDFNYARAAIRAHAWRYLLKPLDPEEMERELRTAAAHLRQRGPERAGEAAMLLRSALAAMAHGRPIQIETVLPALTTPLQCGALRWAQNPAPALGPLEQSLAPEGLCFAYDADTVGVIWTAALPGADAAAGLPGGPSLTLGPVLEDPAALPDCLRALFAPAASEDATAPEGWQAQLHAYIERHYAAAPSIAALSREIGFHKGYLGQLIKRETGQSFHQHVTCVRMEKARQLLRQTCLPIAEVARAVGIRDEDYFAAQFKRATGSTPSAYRRR